MPILLEDTRQQNSKHDIKHKFFAEHGIEVRRTKLYCGDYTLPTDQSVCVDTKKDIQELISDICGKQHARFRDELLRAKEANIKLYILIENDEGVLVPGDLTNWHNPRLDIKTPSGKSFINPKTGRLTREWVQKYPKSTTGVTLLKALTTMSEKYDANFVFCTPSKSAETILRLLGVKEE